MLYNYYPAQHDVQFLIDHFILSGINFRGQMGPVASNPHSKFELVQYHYVIVTCFASSEYY